MRDHASKTEDLAPLQCAVCNRLFIVKPYRRGKARCCSVRCENKRRRELDWHERFWAKVDKSGHCWVWTAGRLEQGYGAFSICGEPQRAHRVSYEIAFGQIPHEL